MFNFGALAANVLNSLDNAAKDTLEEPRVSATALRSQRNARSKDEDVSDEEDNDIDDNIDEDVDDQVSVSFLAALIATFTLHFVTVFIVRERT